MLCAFSWNKNKKFTYSKVCINGHFTYSLQQNFARNFHFNKVLTYLIFPSISHITVRLVSHEIERKRAEVMYSSSIRQDGLRKTTKILSGNSFFGPGLLQGTSQIQGRDATYPTATVGVYRMKYDR